MKAKEYLRQVEKLDAIITNKLIEKAQWYNTALNVTANTDGERVQSSGVQSKMAEAINKCVDMEREIDSIVDRLIAVKKDVVSTIERVDNPTEYNILHKRYIQYIPLKDIANQYDKDYGWATTCHGRALKSVQNILDKRLDKIG